MKKHAFTLIELLVVIVILGILVTLGSKGIRNARLSAKKAQAMVEMKAIETAIMAYQSKYGKLPVPVENQGADEEDVEFDAVFSTDTILALGGDTTMNPAGIVFLEPQGVSSNGVFQDPWGEQYLIFMDTNYDGELPVGFGELDLVVRRKLAILSVGLYNLKKEPTESDIITSW
ncbi:hypothetical protein PDESU_04493 [Pontiella desulfatans]|uniref:Type II secretion system protein G n=1 Tax=Pontiella desulfatans TaxID=2750659 RepID=A0A6C2U7J9_PONDE|nr:type II secretion system protein [Pontiella desulfatans]VGO15905.1 hypothetical protein PDESU_04493 [Pontiella desulfatans]